MYDNPYADRFLTAALAKKPDIPKALECLKKIEMTLPWEVPFHIAEARYCYEVRAHFFHRGAPSTVYLEAPFLI